MKKVFAALFAVAIGVVVFCPAQESDAQVLLSRKCCDTGNNIRCFLDDWYPVGDGCFCPGQGVGHVC